MKYAFGILLLSTFLFLSCNNNENIPFNEELIKKNVLEVMKNQELAWNEGNIEEYMHGYWISDSLRFASGNKTTFGWKSTLENYKKAYSDKSKMGTLEFTDIDIKVLSENTAMVFGKWRLIRSSDEPNGLYTLLFKKTDQGWKIIHDHTSSAQ